MAWCALSSVVMMAAASVLLLQPAAPAKILLAAPQLSSHVLMQLSVGEELVKRGHQVYAALSDTYAGRDSVEQLGIRVLSFRDPSGASEDSTGSVQDRTRGIFDRSFSGDDMAQRVLAMSATASTFCDVDCDRMMSDQSFLDAATKIDFDVVVVEPFILSPCMLLLPYRLRVKFVSMSGDYIPWTIRIPALPSFYPLVEVGVPRSNLDSLIKRLSSLYIYLSYEFAIKPMFWNVTLLAKHAPDVASWDEILLRSELFLTLSDHYLNPALPLFPNVIPVAGVTVKPARPLPADLQRSLADTGRLVVASFGSAAYRLPVDVFNRLMTGCGRLAEHNVTVVARFAAAEPAAGEVVQPVPTNVRLMSWLPQNDLMGDGRTRVFITHCGSNGLREALYHGVPVLGFPLFAEQAANCGEVERQRMGVVLDLGGFQPGQLYDSIELLLNNDSYRATARHLSAAWRDEPLIGRQKAAFWIEHVIKFGGAHLRSPAVDLPLYRFLMLDVLGVLILAAFIALLTAAVCLLKLCRYCCSVQTVPSGKKHQ